MQRDWDLDDWFAEPESELRRASRPVAGARDTTPAEETGVDDDWLAGTAAREQAPRLAAWRDLAGARVLLAGAVLTVLLLVGLAAAGVFSSSGHSPTRTAAATAPPAPTTTATTATTATPTPKVVLPTSTLKPGDTGGQVRELQRALATLGYSPGAADGNYGPATKRAVARFQRASGLVADGIFGAKTLNTLTRVAGP
jgi:murein L,D-transpeptidase YcbB/YkuD